MEESIVPETLCAFRIDLGPLIHCLFRETSYTAGNVKPVLLDIIFLLVPKHHSLPLIRRIMLYKQHHDHILFHGPSVATREGAMARQCEISTSKRET